MKITEQNTLQDIQREFGALFPHLKLDFFSAAHHPGEGSPDANRLDPNLKLQDVGRAPKEGTLSISPSMTVAELEKKFREVFELNVQVMRQSGNLWMQTTATDAWTLERQNRKGGSSKTHYDQKYQ